MNERVNVERYIATMQKAIQCATVSHLDESATDWAECTFRSVFFTLIDSAEGA